MFFKLLLFLLLLFCNKSETISTTQTIKFFRLSSVDIVEGEELLELKNKFLSKIQCSSVCSSKIPCIAFVINKQMKADSTEVHCRFYKSVSKFFGDSYIDAYFIEKEKISSSLTVPIGKTVVLNNGLAFMTIEETQTDWNENFNACQQYPGFRMIRPKKLFQFNFALNFHRSLGQNDVGTYDKVVGLDLRKNSSGIYFGDGTPFEHSELGRSNPAIVKNTHLSSVFVLLNLKLDDLVKTGYYLSFDYYPVCESNPFGIDW